VCELYEFRFFERKIKASALDRVGRRVSFAGIHLYDARLATHVDNFSLATCTERQYGGNSVQRRDNTFTKANDYARQGLYCCGARRFSEVVSRGPARTANGVVGSDNNKPAGVRVIRERTPIVNYDGRQQCRVKKFSNAFILSALVLSP